MLHNCRACCAFALFALLQWQLQLQPAEARCNKPDDLANGSIIQRRNLLRFRCFASYVLMGDSLISCGLSGRLSGDRPFCARAGCTPPPTPEHGGVELQRGLAAVIMCEEDFVVAGNGRAYCDGNKWDRTLGVCRHRNHTQSHACDFESEDLCGWVPQVALIQPWRRVATVSHFHSYRTGPRHDHTLQNAYGGHYMLMETTAFAAGNHYLVSPIYPRALSLKTYCCFRFHYFMYGADVGDLVVSVKPHNIPVEQISQRFANRYQKFRITGNQGNQWKEHTITIDEMPDDFQVVFTATDGSAQFGDIAIDDVRLMTGRDCGGGGVYTTTTEPPNPETQEPVVYDMMSCSGRCGESAPDDDIINSDGRLIKSCSCNELCFVFDNCCLDYVPICIVGEGVYDKPEEPAPTTPPPTTKTTTTTVKPTTTTTITTTTRRIPPSTRRTTTTTTTTTTSTTMRTTTTRRIPTSTSTKRPTTTTTRATTTTAATTPTTTTTTTRPNTTTIAATTPTTTTAKPTTTKATTTTSTARAVKAATPTLPHQKRISWAVGPDDIKDDADRQSSGVGPVHILLYLMLAVVLAVGVGSVVYRWRRPKSAANEKTVSFQNTYDRLKKAAVLSVQRRGRNEASTPFIGEVEHDEDNDVQFEELGVDIRDVSEL